MPGKFLIYGLVDPRDGQLRYVGKSCQGLARPKQHGRPYELKAYGHLPVVRLAQKLVDAGLKFDIEVLEELSGKELAPEAEQFWVGYFKMVGADLLNLTPGGDGAPFGNRNRVGKKDSAETRARKSAAMMGRIFSEESCRKMSVAQMGNKKAIGNKSRLGKPHDEGSRLAIARGHGTQPFMDVQSGQVFASKADAGRILGVDQGQVGRVLAGKLKTTAGRTFRFVESQQ
jgi:hypothetical protein